MLSNHWQKEQMQGIRSRTPCCRPPAPVSAMLSPVTAWLVPEKELGRGPVEARGDRSPGDLHTVTQLCSFTAGHWTGTPASPRGTAGLRCRCSTATRTSSFLSAEWAPSALQVGVSSCSFPPGRALGVSRSPLPVGEGAGGTGLRAAGAC